MLTLNWSFLNLLGYPGGPNDTITVNLFFLLPVTGPKQRVEMTLRVLASLAGLALLISYEFIDIVIPRRNLAEFRSVYLEQEKKEWRKEPDGIIPSVRINIMHVRRPWYTLFLGRFYWTWNDGFDPPAQYDANVTLLAFQGVAGSAFKAKQPQGVDLRELPPQNVRFQQLKMYLAAGLAGVVALAILFLVWQNRLPITFYVVGVLIIATVTAIGALRANEFRMWPWQMRRTKEVKYILSVPLFKASHGDSKTWKVVGVINLDTITDEGAEFLKANEGRLATYFMEIGKVVACLK